MIDTQTFYLSLIAAFFLGALLTWLVSRPGAGRRREEYESQISTLRGTISQRDGELNELRAQLGAQRSEVDALTANRTDFESTLNAKEIELQELQLALTAAADEADTAGDQRDKFAEELSLRKREIDQLTEELGAAEEKRLALQAEIDGLARSQTMLEEALDTKSAVAEELMADMEAVEQQLAAATTAPLPSGEASVDSAQSKLDDEEGKPSNGARLRAGAESLYYSSLSRQAGEIDLEDAVVVVEEASDDAGQDDELRPLQEANAEIDRLKRSLSVLTSVSAEMAQSLSRRSREYDELVEGLHALPAPAPAMLAAPEATRGGDAAVSLALTESVQPLAAVAGLRRSLQTMEEELAVRSGAQAELAERLNGREQELTGLRDHVDTLHAELDAINDEKAATVAALVAREDEIGQLRSRLAALETQLEMAGQEHEEVLAELVELQETSSGLELQLAEAGDARAALVAQLDTLRKEHEEQLNEANASFENALAARTEELEALRQTLDERQSELDMQIEAKAELEALVAEKASKLEEARTELTALQSDLYTASAGKSELEGLLAERSGNLSALQEQFDLSQADLETHRTTAADLQAQLGERQAELASLNEQLSALKDEIAGLTGERDSLAAQLADRTAELDAAGKEHVLQLEALSGQKEALEGELQSAQQRVAALTSAGDEAAAGIAAKEKELAAAGQKLTETQGQLADIAAQLEDTRADLAEKEHQLAEANSRLADLNAQVDQAQTELETTRKESDGLLNERAAEIAKLTAAAAVTAKVVKEREEERDRARTELTSLQEQLVSVTRERDDGLARAQSYADELDRVQERLAAADSLFDAAPATRGGEIMVDPLSPSKSASAGAAIAAGMRPTWVPIPQDLSEIKGIGTVYEQRLYDDGIGTFWEVASQPDEELVRVLELSELRLQSMDLNVTRADALRLAQESDTVGHIWDGAQVDDFEPIPGIGKTFERRLYQAGIRTYDDLAATEPDRLAQIVMAPKLSNPNYGEWREKARALLAERRQSP